MCREQCSEQEADFVKSNENTQTTQNIMSKIMDDP